jgi:hypothetical protein
MAPIFVRHVFPTIAAITTIASSTAAAITIVASTIAITAFLMLFVVVGGFHGRRGTGVCMKRWILLVGTRPRE